MKLIKMLFGILCLNFTSIKAQTSTYNGAPVNYYHFYNGVQMIEIDKITRECENRFRGGDAYSREWPCHPGSINPILFRNEQGKIIAQYNVIDEEFNDSDFLSPKAIKRKTIPHNRTVYNIFSMSKASHLNGHIIIYSGQADKKGLIDTFGNVLLKPEYDYIYWENDVYYYKRQNKTGVMNNRFEILIETDYEKLYPAGKPWVFETGGKGGFMNRNFEVIVNAEYEYVGYIGTLHYVWKNGRHGFIDTTGKLLTPLKYTHVEPCGTGNFYKVRSDSGWGFMDSNCSEICPLKYAAVTFFSSGMAPALLNGKWGYIDSCGENVIDFKYALVSPFWGNEAIVRKDSAGQQKYGVIDKNGKEIIPLIYEAVTTFSENLAAVKLNGKFGFIDRENTIVIPFIYDLVHEVFKKGKAKVEINYRIFYIDKKGREIK